MLFGNKFQSTEDHARNRQPGAERTSLPAPLITSTQQPAVGSFSMQSLQITFKSHMRALKATLQAAKSVVPIKMFFTAACYASSTAPAAHPETSTSPLVYRSLGCSRALAAFQPEHISRACLKDTNGSTRKSENAAMNVAQAQLIELL